VELGRREAWWHPEKYLLQVEAKYYLKVVKVLLF
jgi:hypothetical protein